ncbi:hypothetical protein [Qipengyuania nanhaisediminis]|uniref:hypothetical protein n=1 Tax=Qipengyuania nanhaisediminis TaxID=604088 RepID=UPI0038B32018
MSDQHQKQSARSDDVAGETAMRDLRLLPGPFSAAALAAGEAALAGASQATRITHGRALVGSAVIAAAVIMPEIPLGAVDAPVMQVNLGARDAPASDPFRMPSLAASSPVFIQAMAADRLAPEALTTSAVSRRPSQERMAPLGFLATGSERFDLAFAGVALPDPEAITIAAPLASQPHGSFAARTAALRARLIDVPQITATRPFLPRAVREARAAETALTLDDRGIASLGSANRSIEAAFAGTLDVSGGVRDALPIEPVERAGIAPAPVSRAAPPVATPTARTAPVREDIGVDDNRVDQADPGLVALPAHARTLQSSREAQIDLVAKTHLDARVNGVAVGRVDFEQRGATIAVRLGSVVDLLQARFTAEELSKLRSGGAIDAYLTLDQIRAAGIPINYDPVYDEIEFGIDYQDAPQAAKVQVEQIGVPVSDQHSVMIDQIPR